MFDALYIALGAFLGAISRVGVSHLSEQVIIRGIPVATLLVNIMGSFALGLVLPAVSFPSPAFWFLVIGFLSSLTTFSTLVMEIDALWSESRKNAVLYAFSSLTLGVIFLICGYMISYGTW